MQIVDFGDLPVFQNATTYPCIIITRKNSDAKEVETEVPFVVDVKTLQFENLKKYITENKQALLQNNLEDSGWHLGNEKVQALLKKLQNTGVPLGEYVKGKVYYGIKTGLNEAFVIDEETKDRLIEEDVKSAEIIKPFLAGRDVKRYEVPPKGKYLILFPKGFTNTNGRFPKNAWKWLEENYPSLSKYLKVYKEKGEKRYDKGDYWWELRTCDYYEKFKEPKIIVPAIVKNGSYCFDSCGFYSNDKTSIISTDDLYILGVLNSKGCDYFLKSIASTKQGGYYEYKPMYFSKVPIPTATIKQQDEIRDEVKKILALNKEKQTSSLPEKIEQLNQRIAYIDEKINKLVFELYGLSAEDIEIVEGR